jgi:hypothetical protein
MAVNAFIKEVSSNCGQTLSKHFRFAINSVFMDNTKYSDGTAWINFITLRRCYIDIQHSPWLMLTTSADPLTPKSPYGLGVASRCSARLQIFQEGNPAAGERSLYYGVTNYVVFSMATPQCIVSLCLRTRLKSTGSLNWCNLLTYVLWSPFSCKFKQPDISTQFLHRYHNQWCKVKGKIHPITGREDTEGE